MKYELILRSSCAAPRTNRKLRRKCSSSPVRAGWERNSESHSNLTQPRPKGRRATVSPSGDSGTELTPTAVPSLAAVPLSISSIRQTGQLTGPFRLSLADP